MPSVRSFSTEPAPTPQALAKNWQRRVFVLRVGAFAAVPAVAPVHALSLFGRAPQWPAIKKDMRERHPAVPQLTTQQLQAWLTEGTRTPPLLLDARAPQEYALSHLRGAKLTPDLRAALSALQGLALDTPVVVYCSVGVRSSALAEQLIGAGWRNVSNLEGSLFEWANLGYPLFRGAVPVTQVHPYNKTWGTLLDRRRWDDSAL
jgi:rhodanese-related sulfurtransferase